MKARRLVVCGLLLAALTACTGGGAEPTHTHHGHTGHTDEGPGQTGRGLVSTKEGFTLAAVTASEPGHAGTLAFRILAPDGKAQTKFRVEETKQIHVYVVRKDLTDFDHVHPLMASDGTWTAPLTLERPGPYRVVTEFVAIDADGKDHHMVLGRDVTVPGSYQPQPLPEPSTTARIGTYELAINGGVTAIEDARLTVFATKNGRDVTYLQPFLDSYAHLTGFREGDLAVVHLHPDQVATGGAPGGPELTFDAAFPGPGRYRLFVQFQVAGAVQTAATTLEVG